MQHAAGRLRPFVSLAIILVAGEPARTAAPAACETRRLSCIAECRAQYFSIDPKRDACIARCVADAGKCRREQEPR
jgi:hypothetical protein